LDKAGRVVQGRPKARILRHIWAWATVNQLLEQVATGSRSNELERSCTDGANLVIDEKPIRFNVAFSSSGIFP
jgi:hypothetical protein